MAYDRENAAQMREGSRTVVDLRTGRTWTPEMAAIDAEEREWETMIAQEPLAGSSAGRTRESLWIWGAFAVAFVGLALGAYHLMG